MIFQHTQKNIHSRIDVVSTRTDYALKVVAPIRQPEITHTAKKVHMQCAAYCQIVTLSFASLVRLLLMANYPRLSLQAKSNI